MLLFFISLILVFSTSFFVTVLCENKKFIVALIYFLLVSFANVVVTFEILSLFSAISTAGVLSLNVILLLLSALIWNAHKRPVFNFEFKSPLKSFAYSLLKDKYLLVLAISCLFMCTVSLWLISFMPVVNPDAEGYHVLRSLFYISNRNLNHFNIADIRCNDLPFNSEILYAWVLLFVKKSVWFGIFSFMGFVLSVAGLFGILTNIGLSLRKRLWVILIMSSFASVIVQISGTETDIIISGLVLSSIYLYWNFLKSERKSYVFMSALSYALAIGTKTPALMLVPGVGVWMIVMSIYYKRQNFYKPFGLFLLFGLLNFVLFGAYNYILNFIEYGNIAGSASLLAVHKNPYGFRSVACDFVKYIFMFFDFTGFTWNKTLGVHVMNLRDNLLNSFEFLYVPDGLYTTKSNISNNTLIEPLMGLGILGFLVYLPCFIYAIVRPVFSRRKKDLMIFSFAVILLVTLFVMAYEIQFMTFSIRFLTSFCVVSAPILAYSYCKKNNLAKFIIVFFAIYYLTLVSTNLWARSVSRILRYFKAGASISDVREIAVCSGFFKDVKQNPFLIKKYPVFNVACGVRDKIKMIDKRNKILYFSNAADTLLVVKMMEFGGYKIHFDLAENVGNIDFDKYNVLIVINDMQQSTNIKQYEHCNTDGFFISGGVVCKYSAIDFSSINPGKHSYPYKTFCNFTNSFFTKHGYRLYKEFTIDYLEKSEVLKIQFKIYENVNNPIINPLN